MDIGAMAKKSKGKRRSEKVSAPELDADKWDVSVDFRKGVLSGMRGVVVEVRRVDTGVKRRVSATAKTKNQARQVAAELVQRLVEELES